MAHWRFEIVITRHVNTAAVWIHQMRHNSILNVERTAKLGDELPNGDHEQEVLWRFPSHQNDNQSNSREFPKTDDSMFSA
jgi:hypothetical protein